MKPIKMMKLEYDTKDGITWKAVVLAYDLADGIQAIRNKVPNFDRLISTGACGDVDLISKAVYDDYFVHKQDEPNKKETTKDEVVEEKQPKKQIDESTIEYPFVCPVCKKGYKTMKPLDTHMKKFHS